MVFIVILKLMPVLPVYDHFVPMLIKLRFQGWIFGFNCKALH